MADACARPSHVLDHPYVQDQCARPSLNGPRPRNVRFRTSEAPCICGMKPDFVFPPTCGVTHDTVDTACTRTYSISRSPCCIPHVVLLCIIALFNMLCFIASFCMLCFVALSCMFGAVGSLDRGYVSEKLCKRNTWVRRFSLLCVLSANSVTRVPMLRRPRYPSYEAQSIRICRHW